MKFYYQVIYKKDYRERKWRYSKKFYMTLKDGYLDSEKAWEEAEKYLDSLNADEGKIVMKRK